MKTRGAAVIPIIVISAIIIAVGAGSYFLGTQKNTEPQVVVPKPTTQPAETIPVACTMDAKLCPDGSSVGRIPPSCEFAPCPTAPNTKPGWNIYKNDTYHFQLSYPSKFKALDDKNNLYGWVNGVVLLYAGGQSYDLAVQVWDSNNEYESGYKKTGLTDPVIKIVQGKYITLTNTNNDPQIDQIIATFQETQ